MKKILITGAESYVGTSFERWLNRPQFAGRYQVDTVDMRGESWKKYDFSIYDVVFHVAGIVHQKEKRENKQLYFEINCNLAIEVAKKAQKEGVTQFVFLSSMSVYGMEEGVITLNSKPFPNTYYGKSKLQAEKFLREMRSDTFKIAIIRPPMIYGKGCKGNYVKLSKLAQKCFLFPKSNNKRSMLYIENFCEFTREIIEDKKDGLFYPQDKCYINTSEMVKKIAESHNKKVFLFPFAASVIKVVGGNLGKKVFGTLIYELDRDKCSTVNFDLAIRRTEK